ncbi:hypothetical protein FRX31_021661 [Thalictrum thalictroides]|uniref:Uncharacterized protein n=1 Tax=Thalictrum thalictroides TaxID=46969 RepID=A0A7J6VV58_THATH|nr:hypothetical protein FRX31_021661 [Thalictrum thalictroides]
MRHTVTGHCVKEDFSNPLVVKPIILDISMEVSREDMTVTSLVEHVNRSQAERKYQVHVLNLNLVEGLKEGYAPYGNKRGIVLTSFAFRI